MVSLVAFASKGKDKRPEKEKNSPHSFSNSYYRPDSQRYFYMDINTHCLRSDKKAKQPRT